MALHLMRVIAGLAKGRTLTAPKGNATRPMTERAREGLFSSLGDIVAGARVLDLYAGSGSLGIEALSRGSQRAVFVERQAEAIDALRKNLDAVGLGGEIATQSVEEYVSRGAAIFDLVFVDPPYAAGAAALEELLDSLQPLVAPGGNVVLHRRKGSPPVTHPPWLTQSAFKGYGDTELFRFERSQ